MEPVISLVLSALAAGAQAAARGIATDEVKRIYKELKTLIQQKWIGKPSAEKLLSEYEKDPESWEQVLAEKLEQSGISQNKPLIQKAEQLLQIVNVSASVDQSRQASSGDTATTRATISKDTISANRDAIKIGRDQIIQNRQSRLTVLLWLLALALTGVIGLGVYLFMTGRLQLPGQPSIPGQVTNSEKPSATSERRVTQTALDSIQSGMTFAQVEEKLGVHLKLDSEISYANAYANTPLGSLYESMTNIKSVSTYSCVLEDGSLFYFAFSQTAQSDSFVLYVKSHTPLNLTKPGSSN